MAEIYPCITHLRHRETDRRANTFAADQQRDAEAGLAKLGYEIVGRFGDPEFAPPYRGWLEPRPGWVQAVAAAAEISQTAGSCTLVVLRADGIGSGDMFLPEEATLEGLENVHVRVCGFSLRGHADATALKDAHARLRRYKERERARGARLAIDPRGGAGSEISLEQDYRKRCTRAFYRNRDSRPAEITWQTCLPSFTADGTWVPAGEPTQLMIPAHGARCLETFFQDESRPLAVWWRFKGRKGPIRKTGNVIFTSSDLVRSELQIEWYEHEPAPLLSTDFQWESRPAIETRRLRLRNWRPEDARAYASACNTTDVMRFLGGVQSDDEMQDDLAYFADLGRRGPTYWAVERVRDGALLGFCGALVVEEARSPVIGEWEIGWGLGSAYWGQGYAYEAATAVLHSLFEEWNLKRVVCRVDSSNLASIRLAERLGMTEHPARRHEGDEEQVLRVFEMSDHDYWRTGMTPAALD